MMTKSLTKMEPPKWVSVPFSTSWITTTTHSHTAMDIGDLCGLKMMNRGKPLPLPNWSIPEAKGHDMDFINVAYSNLTHSRWDLLNQMASGLTQFRVSHVLLKTHKDYFLAHQFFNWAEQQRGFSHSLESHCLIFHVLTRAKKFRAAEGQIKKIIAPKLGNPAPQIFECLVNTYRLCDSSPRSFDALFKTYAHSKKLRNARDVFYFMKTYGFLPTVESCNAYLSSLLKLNRTDLVHLFYTEMLRSGIPLNVYTFNMVIHALCKSGKLQKAGDVLCRMEKMGCSPSVVSYNALIDGHCKHGLLTAALKLMKEMSLMGLVSDVVTYNAVIHGFCKEGKVNDANKLFYEMRRMGLSPNTVTYNILINAYSDKNNSEMGFLLYEEMAQKGVQLNLITYNAVIRGLCKEGRMRKANHLLKEMAAKNFEANSSTFAALIDGYCRRKKYRTSIPVVQENGEE